MREAFIKVPFSSRGVLSLAWCPEDSDLLMSCGKVRDLLLFYNASFGKNVLREE